MDELSDAVSCLKAKGIIIDRGALDYLKENDVELDELEAIKPESLFLTRQMLEAHIQKKGAREANEEEQCTREDAAQPKSERKTNSAKDVMHSVSIESLDIDEPKERSTESFVEYFNARYCALKNILAHRQELKNLVSLGRLGKYSMDKNISVIGIVSNIGKTKNGNTMLDLEDPTGRIKVIIREDKDIGEADILNDEIIGVSGSTSNGFMFADSIVYPEVPVSNVVKKVRDKVSAAFISDLHYGSRYFSKTIESRFLKWIHSDDASQIKYLFICGDIADGVGIYPGQEQDLIIRDIYSQYGMFEEFIMKIPGHIQIIVCPGNHDAVRMGEPQPKFPRELLPRISDMDNVHLATNPAYVNVHAIGSGGIDVLMYHGYSFTSIVDAVPYLRQKGLKNPRYVMEYVLKRRHLAPPYGATIAVPEKNDSLVISKIPDIFQTGDLHSHEIGSYRNITLISSSTFQDQTPFMDRVGHFANPGKISVVDLSTRETRCVDLSY